jgi:hypothetical protein
VNNGSQYGVSGTGHAVFGTGARLANGGWIKVDNINLGADRTLSLAQQIAYQPNATQSGDANDKRYDPTVYGDWYQWGREADGHENRKVLASGTVSDYLNSPNGVRVDSLDANGQIKSDLPDVYGKFIQRDVSTYDWRQYPETDVNSTTAHANAWTWGNPVNGITALDPCQSLGTSWRVPTQVEWAQIASNNTWVWQDGGGNGTSGYLIKPGGANKPASLFLPAAGRRGRIGGAQLGVGSYCDYWSSTVIGAHSYNLYSCFDLGIFYVANTGYRANAFSVRCVSE